MAGKKTRKTDAQWKKALAPERYAVMRKGETEQPFSGKYNDFWQAGTYVCAGCGTPLFRSEAKYDHGTGWPSFTTPVDDGNLVYKDDYSLLMKRVEVRCAACGGHLGHVFDDGPEPTFLHYCINSASLDFHSDETSAPAGGPGGGSVSAADGQGIPEGSAAKAPPRKEKATFAAGCFWGVECRLAKVPGVLSTSVGYTGGTLENPGYEAVCTGETGHAESVEVIFDPDVVSFERLVRRFFEIHDPTQAGRQGPDVGAQYRSAIFYHDKNQESAARKVMEDLRTSGALARPLATELVPAGVFYRAEEYHQRYFKKHGIICD